jgi:nicotinate-nucleotide adenylyltransferase
VKPRRPGRIGIFGGTFDPPHLGHLLLAECARETLGLDRVVFVPARVAPHKIGRRMTPVEVRLGLLRAALRGTGFTLSTIEARRPGPSYTVDTLEALRRRHPDAEFHLLVGADSLLDLPAWKDPARILALATLAVARRPGFQSARVAPAVRRRVRWLPNAPVDISASDLRSRVAEGRSIRFLTPPAVARMVARLGLYRRARAGS